MIHYVGLLVYFLAKTLVHLTTKESLVDNMGSYDIRENVDTEGRGHFRYLGEQVC